MLYIFSQIFSTVTLILTVISFQFNNKSKLLILFTIANLSFTISYLFLQDWVGAALMAVATLRTLVFYFLEIKNIKKSISISFLLIFIIANIISTILTWTIWFDFVLMIGASLFTFGAWAKGNNLIRITNVVYGLLLIIHNIFVQNWVGIVVESSIIVSIIVYYIKLFMNKNKIKNSIE